jgi:hypothetical protein
MKVLEPMDPKTWRREATCRRCTTKVELNADDLTLTRDYCDGDFVTWFCPVCRNENNIDIRLIEEKIVPFLRVGASRPPGAIG